MGVTPVSVADERLASLRKRLETDSKGLILVRSRDITRGSSLIAKLESSIRNYALEYYKAQAKRVKRYKKVLNKSAAHQILFVRHCFKIAHYYEFRRYTTKVLQHYEAAYRAVVALPLNEPSDKNNDVVGYTQVKTMAEFINFKLCYHLIFSANNVRGAVEQLQRHVNAYAVAVGPPERAYDHWEWLSRQYHVFGQLLAEAVSIRGSLTAPGLDSDIYKEPYLYLSIAAKYATYRRKAAAKLGLTSSTYSKAALNGEILTEKDFIVVPSVFVGGDPVVAEANSPSQEPTVEALVKYRHALERSVPHAKRTLHLLEQSIQHLSIYIADQKTPRSRLKSRLLVQLGTERLAAGEYERARAELQKAKMIFTVERWWAQVSQILKQLLICTFRQGDTAAYIDYSLQLLSPAMEDFVPVNERVRIQESMILAWRDPSRLGSPFTSTSALGDGHEVSLDQCRALFTASARFDSVFACVKENTNLEILLESFFPSSVTISKLELKFTDDRYNCAVLHDTSCEAGLLNKSEDGRLTSLLEFGYRSPVKLTIPLRILEGKEVLRFQEAKFYLSNQLQSAKDSAPEEEYLIFNLLVDQPVPLARDPSHPFFSEGRVPAMGNGSASPSFARRKSMFSLSELSKTSSELNAVGLEDNDGGEDEVLARGPAVVILQPRPKAKLSMVTQGPLIAGDFRMLEFKLSANDDVLENVSFRVRCEPPPVSSAPDDAFFFSQQEPGGSITPLYVDSSLQPRDWMPLASLEQFGEQRLRVIVRSSRAITTRVIVSVAYATWSGVGVSLEEVYEVPCAHPFVVEGGFIHDFPKGGLHETASIGGVPRNKDSFAYIGKMVTLQGALVGACPEALKVLSMEFEPIERNLVDELVPSGFGVVSSEDPASGAAITREAVFRAGDSRSFSLRLLPRLQAPFAMLGRVKVTWRRISSVITSAPDGPRNDIVTTLLDLPTVSFVESPLTFEIHTPPFGVEGMLVPLDLHVKNNENSFHSLRIKPVDETGDFFIAGRTNAIEELLPFDEQVVRIGLIPTKTGTQDVSRCLCYCIDVKPMLIKQGTFACRCWRSCRPRTTRRSRARTSVASCSCSLATAHNGRLRGKRRKFHVLDCVLTPSVEKSEWHEELPDLPRYSDAANAKISAFEPAD